MSGPNNTHQGGGVRLEVPNPRVVRMELSIDPPDGVGKLRIQGIDEEESPRLEWATVTPRPGDRIGERKTYVLRPGEPARGLAPSGATSADGVRWVDVSVEPHPGTETGLTLIVHRAAYLP